MRNIAFRVDGGPEIGMGHLMRCLALADAFPKDDKIIFIIKREKAAIDKLKGTRYDPAVIEKGINYEEEIGSVTDILDVNETDIFIADTYHIDTAYDMNGHYFSEVKKRVDTIVVISPKPSFSLPYDVVINGNAFAAELGYDTSKDETKFLLGPKYALLREEFQGLPYKEVGEKVKDMIVTMGGGDPLNLTPDVLKALDQIDGEGIHVDVVIGPAACNQEEILKVIKKSDLEVSLFFDPTNIGELMHKADLAVSAGGGTLYELAAAGTPAVVLLQADNQIPMVEAMEKEGTIINMGFGSRMKINNLTETLIDLMNDRDKREKMSRRGKELIDGLGAKRCIEAILKGGCNKI